MKKVALFFCVFSFFFSFCKNEKANDSSTTAKVESTTSNSSSADVKNEAEDFWKKNNCTRPIPKPTANEAQKSKGYSFELDKLKGRGIEKISFDKGDELTIINKGCESIWLVYSFSLNKDVHEIDLSDKIAVSKKMLSLVVFSTKLSNPPLDIKGRLPMLGKVIDELGGFDVGQEFILSDTEIKEGFMFDRVEHKNGKLLLEFSFTKGPL